MGLKILVMSYKKQEFNGAMLALMIKEGGVINSLGWIIFNFDELNYRP